MLAVLPDSVKCRVPVAGFAEGRERAVAEFQAEVGRPIRRRRQTIAHEMLDGSFIVTRAGLADFWAFWAEDVEHGLLPFAMPHPRTKQTVTVEFVSVEPPRFERVAVNRYDAGFSVRVLP